MRGTVTIRDADVLLLLCDASAIVSTRLRFQKDCDQVSCINLLHLAIVALRFLKLLTKALRTYRIRNFGQELRLRLRIGCLGSANSIVTLCPIQFQGSLRLLMEQLGSEIGDEDLGRIRNLGLARAAEFTGVEKPHLSIADCSHNAIFRDTK